VDLSAAPLVDHDIGEEGDELGRGVARSGLAQHFAGLGIEGRVQRERAMAVVLKAMPLSPASRERQHRIEPVEGLDGRLLINAEHRGVLRRVQVSPMISAALLSKSGSSEAM